MIGFSAGWGYDNDLSFRRAFYPQISVGHAERPVVFVGPFLAYVADGQTSDGLREPDDLLHTHIIAV